MTSDGSGKQNTSWQPAISQVEYQLVEGRSGYIVATEMLYVETTLEEMWTRVPETVLRQLVQINVKPAVIKIRPGPLHGFLAPIANQIGVSLRTARRLRYLDEAKESMFRFLQ